MNVEATLSWIFHFCINHQRPEHWYRSSRSYCCTNEFDHMFYSKKEQVSLEKSLWFVTFLKVFFSLFQSRLRDATTTRANLLPFPRRGRLSPCSKWWLQAKRVPPSWMSALSSQVFISWTCPELGTASWLAWCVQNALPHLRQQCRSPETRMPLQDLQETS